MKSLCVFCGSSMGNQPHFTAGAQHLGRSLAGHGITLVYGGASVGSMGVIADAALAAGGRVIGVIPDSMVKKELAHRGLTELRVVGSMAERKDVMAELSDGFITMPGGMGTLDEIFEMLTGAQLGFHQKPCAFLNAKGYYDHLLAFIDRAVLDGFIGERHRQLLLVEEDVDALLARLMAYVPESLEKFAAPS